MISMYTLLRSSVHHARVTQARDWNVFYASCYYMYLTPPASQLDPPPAKPQILFQPFLRSESKSRERSKHEPLPLPCMISP